MLNTIKQHQKNTKLLLFKIIQFYFLDTIKCTFPSGSYQDKRVLMLNKFLIKFSMSLFE